MRVTRRYSIRSSQGNVDSVGAPRSSLGLADAIVEATEKDSTRAPTGCRSSTVMESTHSDRNRRREGSWKRTKLEKSHPAEAGRSKGRVRLMLNGDARSEHDIAMLPALQRRRSRFERESGWRVTIRRAHGADRLRAENGEAKGIVESAEQDRALAMLKIIEGHKSGRWRSSGSRLAAQTRHSSGGHRDRRKRSSRRRRPAVPVRARSTAVRPPWGEIEEMAPPRRLRRMCAARYEADRHIARVAAPRCQRGTSRWPRGSVQSRRAAGARRVLRQGRPSRSLPLCDRRSGACRRWSEISQSARPEAAMMRPRWRRGHAPRRGSAAPTRSAIAYAPTSSRGQDWGGDGT